MTAITHNVRKPSALVAALFLLFALIVPLASPAAANHPETSCLDVQPDTDTNPVTNTTATPGTEDNRHVLTATLRKIIDPDAVPPAPLTFATCESTRTGPGDPPPNTTTEPATTPVNIDFEVSGVNDPAADGDTPDLPDLTCAILTSQSSCSVSYVGTVVGTDTIRGWIDHDAGSPAQPGKITEADLAEGQNSTTSPGTGCTGETPSQPEPDCTDVATKTWAPNRLDCAPENADNQVGEPHTVTCTVTDVNSNPVNGQSVDAEASGSNDPDGSNSTNSPDFTSCTTVTDGTCSFTHGTGGTGSTNSSGRTTYRAWIDEDNNNTTSNADETETQCADPGVNPDEAGCTVPTGGEGTKTDPDNTDVMNKDFGGQPGRPFTLDCDDETGPDTEKETNPSLSGEESTETYTCTVRDPSGSPVRNAQVYGENENGVNDPDAVPPARAGPVSYDTPDYECFTPEPAGSNGQCVIEVAQVEGQDGTAEICFWVEGIRTEITPPPSQGASNCGEEPTGEAQNADLSDSGNDLADQVEKTWEPRGAAAAGGIDAEPETDTNTLGDSHIITVTVYDQFGTPFQGTTEVKFEFFQGSPSDTDPAATGNSPASADRTCTTNNSTSCSTTYSQTTTAGTDLICVWINTTPAMTGTSSNGTCDGEGRNDADDDPTTADAPEPRSDDVDVVEKNWAAQRLECLPETDTNPTGTPHTITCTATDVSGTPRSGVSVDAEATGANDPDNPPANSRTTPDFSCTAPTDANGQCSFTHGTGGTGTTNSPGTTTYRAWIDTDNNNATDNSDATEERDETRPSVPVPPNPGGAGTTPEPDGTDVVEKTWTPSQLDCEPETADNQTRSQHTVTCTVRDANNNVVVGTNVDVEATGENDPDNGNTPTSPDFTCTTRSDDMVTPANEAGTCTFTHGPGDPTAAAGKTTYRAWIDVDNSDTTADEADQGEGRDAATTPGTQPEPDATDVVEKNWQSPGLECTPETDSNPTGSSHTITCTDRTTGNQPVAGAKIDAEATGVNDPDTTPGDSPQTPDFSCTTDANGQCSFTHSGNTNKTGTTTYRAWVDSDDSNGTTEADAGEGRNEQTTPGAPEPDQTDVVEKQWTASRLDCTPETATNETSTNHTITCTAKDNSDAVAPGANIDVEATGANDPDSASSPSTPDFTCTTSASGTCVVTHNPSTTQAAGTTTYRAWIDADGVDSSVEADTTETRDELSGAGTKPEPDDTDVVEKTWTRPPARTIDCEPETASKQVNTEHTVTCTVRDRANKPLPGESVSFTEDGPGAFTSPTVVTTNQTGQATAKVLSADPGTETVTGTLTADTGTNEPGEVDDCDRLANDPSGAPAGACSDSVTVTWAEEAAECADGVDNDGDGRIDFPADRGCTSATDDSEASPAGTEACEAERSGGRNVIIGTDGDDVLNGTEDADLICAAAGDDVVNALGGNDLVLLGAGDDSGSGGGGKDQISGGGGNDTSQGGKGNDVLKGQGGNDRLKGNAGNDRLTGGGGSDDLSGGPGDDVLKGGSGNDKLRGGADDDALDGGGGRDRCAGGRGDDNLQNCE